MEKTTTQKIRSFKQLRTWQEAKDFTVEVYILSRNFPSEELYTLTSQIRRSANSVPANIAEGFSRASSKEKKHFYSISLGSLSETLSHLYIAREVGFISEQNLQSIEIKSVDISKMLNGMIKAAQTKGEHA